MSFGSPWRQLPLKTAFSALCNGYPLFLDMVLFGGILLIFLKFLILLRVPWGNITPLDGALLIAEAIGFLAFILGVVVLFRLLARFQSDSLRWSLERTPSPASGDGP